MKFEVFVSAKIDQVKAHAHFTVIDAMDLALLTGQLAARIRHGVVSLPQ